MSRIKNNIQKMRQENKEKLDRIVRFEGTLEDFKTFWKNLEKEN